MSLGLSVSTRVAALFCMDPSPTGRWESPYRAIPGVDVWDRARDATLYKGPYPVVCHPPCRMWGKLKHFAKGREGERALACYAVACAQRWGGVVEHPEGSGLWDICGLPTPGTATDHLGGWSLKVDQYHFGHRCLKPTWLYVVGCPATVPKLPFRDGEPTHEIAGKSLTQGGKHQISKLEKMHTPPAFAAWLVDLARRCVPASPP